MIPRVRTTLGREEIILGVSTCCWVYVYEYGSSGRRSEVDRTRYEEKNKKKERKRPYVYSRTTAYDTTCTP